jgi:glutathione S-transferase
MSALTDYDRVSRRIGFDDKDIESSAIAEYIEDAQALIEGDTEQTYADGDSSYNLARAACTDLAAAYAMIRMLGGKYAGLEFHEEELEIGSQQSTKIQLINKYLARVNHALRILNRSKLGVLPATTTPG